MTTIPAFCLLKKKKEKQKAGMVVIGNYVVTRSIGAYDRMQSVSMAKCYYVVTDDNHSGSRTNIAKHFAITPAFRILKHDAIYNTFLVNISFIAMGKFNANCI